jgi:hypothetical protein
MAVRLVLSPETEQDIREAYDWYENRRFGLGEEFLSCVDACLQRICRMPELHAKVHQDYRTPSTDPFLEIPTMKRREFLAASCLAGVASISQNVRGDTQPASSRTAIELRRYDFSSQEKATRFAQFLAAAFVPAMNRIGVQPVGAFAPLESETSQLYLVLPHESLESAAASRRRLMADQAFLRDGADVLNAPKSDPAYERIESWLLLAFCDWPRVTVPSDKPTRLFQLRIYESHSQAKALKKVEMFNEGGEIAIFEKTGLGPVFFGEALIGSHLPNLTYMLGFDDQAALDAAWDAFRAHPDWQTLKADPQYQDTVSNITDIRLRPLDCSQI